MKKSPYRAGDDLTNDAEYPTIIYSSSENECPQCGHGVFKIRQRIIDYFLIQFITNHRYRCGSMACNWEGNLQSGKKRNRKSI